MADPPHPPDEEEPMRGLTSVEAEELLKKYGPNEIPEEKVPWQMLLLKQFVGLMPFMIEVAALLALISEEYIDLTLILFMLIVNGIIGFYEEYKAQVCCHGLGWEGRMHPAFRTASRSLTQSPLLLSPVPSTRHASPSLPYQTYPFIRKPGGGQTSPQRSDLSPPSHPSDIGGCLTSGPPGPHLDQA